MRGVYNSFLLELFGHSGKHGHLNFLLVFLLRIGYVR